MAVRVREENLNRMIIKGEIPSAISPPPGCRFNSRCPFVLDRILVEELALLQTEPSHMVACHIYDESGKTAGA